MKREHANTGRQLRHTKEWVPACRCGWESAVVRTRAEARLRWREHQQWALASLGLQLRKRREAAAARQVG